MTTCLGKSCLFSVYCACLLRTFMNLFVCASFPFGFEGGMWYLIVLIPDRCLYIYFKYRSRSKLVTTVHTSLSLVCLPLWATPPCCFAISAKGR